MECHIIIRSDKYATYGRVCCGRCDNLIFVVNLKKKVFVDLLRYLDDT